VAGDNFDMSAIGAQSAAVIASLNQAFQTDGQVTRNVDPAAVAAAAAAPVVPVEPVGIPGTTNFIPRGTSQPGQPQQPAVNPLLAQQPVSQPGFEQPQSPINQPAITEKPTETTQNVAPQLTDAQLVQINDQAVYQVPQPDGTVASMTGLELRQGNMRHKDYTQKTQQVAELARTLEPVRTENQTLKNQLGAIEADLRNPQAVAQYVLRTFGPSFFQQYAGGQETAPGIPAAPGYDPNAQATLGQVQQFVAQALANVQPQQQPQIDTAEITKVATQKALATIQQVQQTQAISTALPKILEANPALATIPFAEQTLRFNVLQKYPVPQSAREAVQIFAAEARLLDAQVRQNWANMNKQQVVNQQRLVQNNTLPPQSVATPLAQPVGPRVYVDQNTGQPQWGQFSTDLTAWMTQQLAR
jgi:hypothetical protein